VSGKAIANFFTPVSQKEPEKMSWRVVHDTLLIGRYGAPAATQATRPIKRRKIAAFDFVRLLSRYLNDLEIRSTDSVIGLDFSYLRIRETVWP
jgi:hypothetical protein